MATLIIDHHSMPVSNGRKPMMLEEFLNRMIEALGIIRDGRPKKRSLKIKI